MNKQYYTKTELTRRWTKRLVDKFFHNALRKYQTHVIRKLQ